VNIAVLKAALEKIRNFDVVLDAIKDKVEDVVGGIKDVAGGVCDSLKKLKSPEEVIAREYLAGPLHVSIWGL
jgi:hypothetical protein